MARYHSTLFRGNSAFTLSACLALSVTVRAEAASLAEGEPKNTLNLATVASGLDQATDVAPLADGRVVVTKRGGDITVVKTDGSKVLAGHINVKTSLPEMGLLGIVADPKFATNHYLYVYASVSAGDDADRNKVLRIVLGDDSKLVGAPHAIIDKGLIGRNNHNGGGLFIHKDQLYISVGDSGWNPVAEPFVPRNRLPSCLNSANGKILRVNLDGSVPNDNPLKGKTQVTTCDGWDQPFKLGAPDERIFVWGLRNPFRFWIDPSSDLLWIGDVGETRLEEISIGKAGQHFGYPFVEGTKAYTKTEQPLQPDNACQSMTPSTPCTPPQYDYPHAGSTNCVIGGLILDGCGWPAAWKSRYVFADNGSGSVWTLDVNANRDGVLANSRKNFATASGPASFRMGPDGALYIVEVTGNAVQKITPKTPTTTSCPDPNSGSGGTGGSGGTTSGSGGSGGTTSGAGGSSTASGGSTPASGGTAGVAGAANKGGATASGGSKASSGSSNNGDDTASGTDDGGCSCRTSSHARMGLWGALMALASSTAFLRRKSRARQ